MLTDWWYTYPSEKYEIQLGLLFSIYGKIIQMFQTTNHLKVSKSHHVLGGSSFCSVQICPDLSKSDLFAGDVPRMTSKVNEEIGFTCMINFDKSADPTIHLL